MTNKKDKASLIHSGIEGLDQIFLGGIKAGNIILVEGAPGTGKTNLGMEFIYRGAKDFKENGIIISFESSPDRLLSDAAEFGWNFEGLKRKKQMVKIIYMSPSQLFQDLISPQSEILSEIKQIKAKRILIDGITPLKHFGNKPGLMEFRTALMSLIQNLQKMKMSAMFTRELSSDTTVSLEPDEQFICDTILTLSFIKGRTNIRRCIEIKKSRGQGFVPGVHTLHVVPEQGLRVYQRAQSIPRTVEFDHHSRKKLSTGIPTLDPIIGHGVYEGSITLSVGISGTGKTVMGMQFLAEGIKNGENGLFISLDEKQGQIERNAKTLEIGLEKHFGKEIILLCEPPLELEIDVHFQNIVRIIDEKKIKRVVVDSVVSYDCMGDRDAEDFIYTLATYLKNIGVTTFMNYESPELLGLSQISESMNASAVVDNIILLNYVEISTQMRRAITVPKSRGSAIPQRTREYVIEKGGLRLIDEERNPEVEEVPQLPFSAYYGVLSRAPARHSPAIDSKIMKGEELPH